MVTFAGLALIVAGVVALVVIAVLAAPLVTDGEAGTRCTRCGATKPSEADACSVCEVPFGTGDADEADERPRTVHVELPEEGEDGTVVNPSVPRGLVKVAGVVMLVGIAVRVLGMLEPAGVSLGVPAATTAAVTVVGGLAMFAGFVVLDVA